MPEQPVFPVRPYTLPLTREQFETALHRGHGRALRHVREHGAAGWDDVIVHTLTNAHIFDMQCEEDRTSWLLDVAEATGRAPAIIDAAVAAADTPVNRDQPASSQSRDLWQRESFLHIAAKKGHPDAKPALYRMLGRGPEGDLIAAREIIELDGDAGLLHVAGVLGADSERKCEEWEAGSLVYDFDARYGEGAAAKVLAAAPQSAEIAAFLSAVRAKPERAQRPPSPEPATAAGAGTQEVRGRPSVQDVIADVRAMKWRLQSIDWRWCRTTTPSEIEAICNALLEDAERATPEQLRRYLHMLWMRPLEVFDPRLIGFADHPDRLVRRKASFMLGKHSHPAIRRFALDRLATGRIGDADLHLFSRNYEPGDVPRLVGAMLAHRDDINVFHWSGSLLLEVCQHNADSDTRELAAFLCETTPCSNCREGALRVLIESGLCPEWIREEAKLDGDGATRHAAMGLPSRE